jgi:hypothetical protein
MNVMDVEWHAKPNDLIGGWCVMPEDKTPARSELAEVADMLTEDVAKYIAMLHNRELISRRYISNHTVVLCESCGVFHDSTHEHFKRLGGR